MVCWVYGLALQGGHFCVFGKAGAAADEDVHQAGQAIEKPSPEKIKFDEAYQGREQQVRGMGALALCQCRVGGQRAVAVLFVQIVFQRLCGIVEQVACERSYRSAHCASEAYFFVHHIGRPLRMAPVKAAHVPIGVAFAMTQVTTHEAIAPGKAISIKSRLW